MRKKDVQIVIPFCENQKKNPQERARDLFLLSECFAVVYKFHSAPPFFHFLSFFFLDEQRTQKKRKNEKKTPHTKQKAQKNNNGFGQHPTPNFVFPNKKNSFSLFLFFLYLKVIFFLP